MDEAAREAARVGLCASCSHHRLVVSGKGSRFHFCERSKTDPRYPKYPPLPVLRCAGWEPAAPEPLAADDGEG
ncbi:MAG TPA: hypothetical protein VMM35_06130 [Longimicrobiales bacterium]|nr:hypothetical protein [Longimicrobiales bacterium]